MKHTPQHNTILTHRELRELWRLLIRSKDASIFQISKSKWLKEGDANSKYFHRCVKARASRNSLKAIKVDDIWVETPTEVRRAVVDYFTSQVAGVRCERPTLDGVEFAMLSLEENSALVALFSLLKIEEVIKNSDGNKSPDPDGFNFSFFKEFWYLLKYEIRILFDQFHANEVIPKSFLSYFVTLIPKVVIAIFASVRNRASSKIKSVRPSVELEDRFILLNRI
jgi:hypothetical protein